MAEIEPEVVERVRRWCAEAGRQAGTGEIRAALGALSWDELLHAKSLLADPPPARPLGPYALADMARGAPADLAADREREGRYRPEAQAGPAAPAARSPRRAGRAERRPSAPRFVIHRARDRAPEAPPIATQPPSLEELRHPGGRAVLERMMRKLGARRAALVAELTAGWRRADGSSPGEEDLATLLDLHGLTRAFERRERDEALHALRAEGGFRPRAGARLGLDVAGLDATLARLGAAADAERIREERRRDLRARATLTERAHLLLDAADRLADLGIAEEVEADLRRRLPEHLRALAAAGEPASTGLARTLSLSPESVAALAARLGLDLGGPPARFESRPRGAPGRERAATSRDRPGRDRSDRRGARPHPPAPEPKRRGGPSGSGGRSIARGGRSGERGPRKPARPPRRGPAR
jgi:hypothetical protein